MRKFPDIAESATLSIGRGDLETGVTVYYYLLECGCNVLLPLMALWNWATLRDGVRNFPDVYPVRSEALSFVMLALVVLARWLAFFTGHVRDWFYLAWPDGLATHVVTPVPLSIGAIIAVAFGITAVASFFSSSPQSETSNK
jgi:hypothetical protein